MSTTPGGDLRHDAPMTTAEPMPSTYHCQHCQKQVVLAAVEGVGWSWVHVASGRVECGTVSVDGL